VNGTAGHKLIRYWREAAALAAALGVALAAVTVSSAAAMASIGPHSDTPPGSKGQRGFAPPVILQAVGVPGWEAALIAVGAAAVAAALTVLACRHWAGRRPAVPPAAVRQHS
jgi:hypothetical protein